MILCKDSQWNIENLVITIKRLQINQISVLSNRKVLNIDLWQTYQ